MKKTINRLLLKIVLILTLSVIAINEANAQAVINNIAISTPQDGKAQVTWATDQPAKSDVYFGEKADKLDRHVAYIEYRRSHIIDLTGLKKDTDYYYKIIVVNESGQKTESFIQYFNTNKMKDSLTPTIGGVKVLQAIDKAAAIYFLTDEPTKVEIRYGLIQDNLDRKISDSSLQRAHLMIINNLTPGNRYYYKILAKDDDGNLAENGGDFVTDAYGNYDTVKVLNLIPSSNNQAPLLAERAVISWESNVVATADISYGLDPEKLSKTAKVSTAHQLEHKAELSGLTPSSTYYFKIKMSSKLNNKKSESQIYSFKTAPITLDYLGQYFKSGDIAVLGRDCYYLYGGGKIKLNNNSLVSRGYSKEVGKKIEEKYLKPYIDLPAYYGAYHDGQVVKEAKSPTVYLIDREYRRPIASWFVFKYLNYQAKDIIIDNNGYLKNYKIGEIIRHSKEIVGNCPISNNSLVKSPEGKTVYLIVNGQKLPFAHGAVFSRLGYDFSKVKTVKWPVLVNIPIGQPII